MPQTAPQQINGKYAARQRARNARKAIRRHREQGNYFFAALYWMAWRYAHRQCEKLGISVVYH